MTAKEIYEAIPDKQDFSEEEVRIIFKLFGVSLHKDPEIGANISYNIYEVLSSFRRVGMDFSDAKNEIFKQRTLAERRQRRKA